jgi:hypothetical protein
MVTEVKMAAAVEDVVALVVMVGLVAMVEVALVDEVEVVMTGQTLLMALTYWTQFKTLRMKNGGNLHIMVDGCMWLRLMNKSTVGDVEVVAGVDAAVKVMVAVVYVEMIMVAVIMLVPLEQIVMMEDKVLKWLAKVMLQVEIVVLSMVVDLVTEHIITGYLGCRHFLLVLFMDLSKR